MQCSHRWIYEANAKSDNDLDTSPTDVCNGDTVSYTKPILVLPFSESRSPDTDENVMSLCSRKIGNLWGCCWQMLPGDNRSNYN